MEKAISSVEQHVENFIEALLKKDALMEDVKKYLTKTQQHTCKFVGNPSVEGAINGLHSILKQSSKITVKEKYSTNLITKDCLITMKFPNNKPAKIQCRLVKEIDVRKTGEDGIWGVNASSFKYIK